MKKITLQHMTIDEYKNIIINHISKEKDYDYYNNVLDYKINLNHETDDDKLNRIDLKTIETYLRKKKLENINNK